VLSRSYTNFLAKRKHIPVNRQVAESASDSSQETFQKWKEYEQAQEKEEYDAMIEQAMEEAYKAIEAGTEHETDDDEAEKLSLIASNITAFAAGDIEKYMSWPLDRIKLRIHTEEAIWKQRDRPDDADDNACSRGYF
jgi:hypothetical protein